MLSPEDLAPFADYLLNREDELAERLEGVVRPKSANTEELIQFKPTFFSGSQKPEDFNEPRALICSERLLSSFQLVADDLGRLESALLEILGVIIYEETLLFTKEEGRRILNFFEVASVNQEVRKLPQLKDQGKLRELIVGFFRSFQTELRECLRNSTQESTESQNMTSDLSDVEDRVLSLEEVAELTKISTSTLYKRKRGGNYPPMFKLNGMLVCKKSELEAWLKTVGQKRSLADDTLY